MIYRKGYDLWKDAMMFSVLTLFPELVDSFFAHGMIGRAVNKEIISGRVINIRSFSTDRHNTVDDRPYGGGCGMVMKPEPLAASVQTAKEASPGARVIAMTPQGKPFDQSKAWELAALDQGLIFVCGRYEGMDERIYQSLVDEEISIGDYVMTGGELAAMVIVDAVARLIPGVLGKKESADMDSFKNHRLEYDQYTRPPVFEGRAVPDVLLSGDHGKIKQWRMASALKRTFLKRPDLFEKRPPDPEEKKVLKRWCRELAKLVDC